MVRIFLKRISSTKSGTWNNILDVERNPLIVTAEPPESFLINGNVYICKLQTHFPQKGKGYPAYEITGIEGHTDVEFHIGNIPIPYMHKDEVGKKWMESDSKGCHLTGTYFGTRYDVDDKAYKAVIDSTKAYKKFMNYFYQVREFELEVIA
jgi:hypothetical protein